MIRFEMCELLFYFFTTFLMVASAILSPEEVTESYLDLIVHTQIKSTLTVAYISSSTEHHFNLTDE